MNEQELLAEAYKLGFEHAAIMDAKDLVYVPAYRQYCEENACGNYGVSDVCPPLCGTAEAMHGRMTGYRRVLVLQTEFKPDAWNMVEYRKGQRRHNELTEQLIEQLGNMEFLVMSAGPWKSFSCMSAYCIDATKMAESCNLLCWGNDGIVRCFSSVLYDRIDGRAK